MDGLPFPHKLKRADALNIIDGVTRALAPLDRFVRYDMSGISSGASARVTPSII